MIDTGKYILEKERKENNTELTIFNGLFSGKYIIFCELKKKKIIYIYIKIILN